MDFQEILTRRQSCRAYDPDKVPPRNLVEQVLEAGRMAPSACNGQPYHFYVVQGPQAARVGELTRIMGINGFTGDVPCFIVITRSANCARAAAFTEQLGQDFRPVDIGIAAAYLTARACELGLSTCILGCFDEPGLQSLLGTRDAVSLVIALGYARAGDPLRTKKRREPEQLITWVGSETDGMGEEQP